MSLKRFTAIDTLQYLLTKDIIETQTKQKIEKVLLKTHQESSMVGVVGEEGIGKSTSCAEYALSAKNVYYIRAGQSYNAKTLFHELIFLITDNFPIASTGHNTSMNILSLKLTATPEKKLIIIDDAGKLKSAGLGLFHELRDNTRFTTGFVFLGLEYFRNNLVAWTNSGKVGIGEFFRRIDYWYSLPKLSDQEKLLYLKMRGIELDAKLREILREVAVMWDLEAKVNMYLETNKKKVNSLAPTSK